MVLVRIRIILCITILICWSLFVFVCNEVVYTRSCENRFFYFFTYNIIKTFKIPIKFNCINFNMTEKNKSPKPGLLALQNMTLLKSESSVFKVPKVPKNKNTKKTTVLDEDLYVEVRHCCNINTTFIVRDFSPLLSCCLINFLYFV